MFDTEEKKVARDLRTSFMGTGMRGFAQLLKKGCFLGRIESDEDMHIHNDRAAIIQIMVTEKNMDKLVEHLCRGIMELSKDA